MFTGIGQAYLDTRSLVNFTAYFTNSLILIVTYLLLDKDNLRQLKILKYVWNIGIFIYLVALSFIYVCQLVEVDCTCKHKFIEITKYDLPNWLLPLRLFAFILPFISAIFVRRQLNKKLASLTANSVSNQNDDQIENETLLLYQRFQLRLKFLWPIVDFFARSNFIVLSFTIIVLAIHWKLCISSLIYLAIVCSYYLILPFKLQSSRRLRLNGPYQQLDEDFEENKQNEYNEQDGNIDQNIKSLIDQSDAEDIENKKTMIRCRYWVNGTILIFTCL